MNCRDAITIASDIPVYRDNCYRNCYIQAGNAIYYEGLANARKFSVRNGGEYRDCDIHAGVVTACDSYSTVSHFPDEEARIWIRLLKSSLCLLSAAWKPDDCTNEADLPGQVTYF